MVCLVSAAPSVPKEIEAAYRRLSEAILAKDYRAIERFYIGSVWIAPDGTRLRPRQMRTLYEANFKAVSKIIRQEIRIKSVRQQERGQQELQVEYIYGFSMFEPSSRRMQQFELTEHSSDLWQRQGNAWRLSKSMVSQQRTLRNGIEIFKTPAKEGR
jgi:ketosteroid isomerase-like protein